MQPPVNHHNLNINHLEEDTGPHWAMKHGVYGNHDIDVKFDHPVEVVVYVKKRVQPGSAYPSDTTKAWQEKSVALIVSKDDFDKSGPKNAQKKVNKDDACCPPRVKDIEDVSKVFKVDFNAHGSSTNSLCSIGNAGGIFQPASIHPACHCQ